MRRHLNLLVLLLPILVLPLMAPKCAG